MFPLNAFTTYVMMYPDILKHDCCYLPGDSQYNGFIITSCQVFK